MKIPAADPASNRTTISRVDFESCGGGTARAAAIDVELAVASLEVADTVKPR